jgi:hypothetical protein
VPGEKEGGKMMSFDEIMTERIKQKIKVDVQRDYDKLHEAFGDFIRKYCMSGVVSDFRKIKEHTIQNLSSRKRKFEMFPKLEEFLLQRESHKIIDSLIASEEATETWT